MPEQLLTVAQVARYLNVNEFTIYRMIADGRLTAFKVGNQWRFKETLIERWLNANANVPGLRKKTNMSK
jgi:excisionase family DNA binding protein